MKTIRLVGAKQYSYNRFLYLARNADGRRVAHTIKDEVADHLLRQRDPVTGAPYFLEGMPPAKKPANKPKPVLQRQKEDLEPVKVEVVDPELDADEARLAIEADGEGDDIEGLETIQTSETDVTVEGDSSAVPV